MDEKIEPEEETEVSSNEGLQDSASKKREREMPNLKNWLALAPRGWNTSSKKRTDDSDGS